MNKVLLIWCIFGLLFMRVQLNTMNRERLISIIYRYKRNCIKNNVECFVDYDDIYPYLITCFVPWHWRIEKMMPEAKFKIIESYL